MNRRDFIRNSVLAGGAAQLASRSAKAALQQVAPSQRITVGVLGAGARAQDLMDTAMELPGVEIVALCDAYSGRAQRARQRTGGRAEIYSNYQEILDLKGVDAVFIGSPDHWHRQMALDSLKAGKDVYIEKPMTYTVDEGLEIIQAAGKSDRIFQVGSQGMSSATQETARQMVQEGKLGQVTMIRASYNRNTASGAWIYPIPPDASPETVGWEQFSGSAPRHPFSLERFFRWRCYKDYSGGIATDLFVHLVTSIHFITGARMPESVMASGQLYRWTESRDVADTVNAILVYPEGFTANLSSTFNNQSSSESGFEIMGTEGTLSFRGGRMVFSPENVYENNRWVVTSWPRDLERAYYSDPEVQKKETPSSWAPRMHSDSQEWREMGRGATHVHLSRFFDSVRSRKKPLQDALMGHRAASCAHLVNLSMERKAAVYWDFEREKVKD